MRQREIVEGCLVDVIRAVGKHDLSKADESLLAAIFMSAAIHSTLEDAAEYGAVERERKRLLILLTRLGELVAEWAQESEARHR